MSATTTLGTRPYPPGPPDIPGGAIQQFLSYRKLLQDPIGRLTDWVDQYGDVMHYMSGNRHQYVVANPEMVREILVRQAGNFPKGADYSSEETGLARFMGQGLVTSNGDFWKRQRRLVAPSFHTRRVTAYADTMVTYAQERMSRWRDGATMDVDEEMMQLTLLIVSRTLFDADASTTVNRVKSAVDVVQKASNTAILLPNWIPTPLRVRSKRAKATLDDIVYGFIDERRASGEDHGDLLSMLLLFEDEDGESMSDKQVRDEAVTLFLAGHETTANTLNWTFWLLAQYPEVEAKLHAELDDVLGGAAPTLADLKRLPYTDMVIKEAMRLMPPVWSIGRMCSEDTEVAGYPFPARSYVQISIFHLHRNPDIWAQPNDFLPERWGDGSTDDLHRYAYLPFGGGPRICIGNSFAIMEANLLLATIAGRWRLRLAPGANVVPYALITMFPRYGLPMTFHARK